MQIILQATHGVVSGAPEFFKRAFGDTPEEFERLLLLPHDFIFNRDWYELLDGRDEFKSYHDLLVTLRASDRSELVQLLSSCDPRYFETLVTTTTNPKIRRLLPYYVPRPKDFLAEIWKKQNDLSICKLEDDLAEDERVEDAGLDDEDEPAHVSPTRKTRSNVKAITTTKAKAVA